METATSLSNFENENYSEIKAIDVSLDELKKWGMSDKILSSECFLYKIYGDKIIKNQEVDDIDESKTKVIRHLDDEEKLENEKLSKIYEEIENSKFDEDLEILIKKLGE